MELLNYHIDVECKEVYPLPELKENQYQIICFSTPGQYVFERNQRSVCENDILIRKSNADIQIKPSSVGTKSVLFDYITIESSDFDSLLAQYPIPLNEAFKTNKELFLRSYIKRIIPEFNFRNPGYELVINGALSEMYIALFRTHNFLKPYQGTYSDIYDIRKEIIEHPEKQRNLADLAEKAGYSVCRFSQLYNELFKISPINDVIKQRINMASKLLETKHFSISDVSDMCGFHSLNYFSRCFRKHTGRTPTQFIKSMHK